MKRMWWVIPLLFIFVSCGKNDGFYGAFPAAAPPISSSYYPPPGVPVAQYPYQGGPGSFNPGMFPQGYPQQFTPFMPVWQYFQQSPPLQQYWSNFWSGWQQYAGAYGYDQFDFIPFWYNYCPSQWQQNYSTFYSYFNYNVYFWLTPQMQVPQNLNPMTFWQGYAGFPYSPVSNVSFY